MSTAVRWQNRQNPQGDSNRFSVDFGKGRARKLRARPLEESWSPVGLVDLEQLHGGLHPILHIPAAAADVADHRDLAQQGVPGGVNVAAAGVAAGVVGDSDDVSAAAFGSGVRILHFGSFRFRRAAPHRASNAARSAGAGAGRSVFGVSSIPLTGSGGRKTGWREGWTPRSAPRRRWRREPGRGTDRSRRPGRTAQWWRCLRRWHTPER